MALCPRPPPSPGSGDLAEDGQAECLSILTIPDGGVQIFEEKSQGDAGEKSQGNSDWDIQALAQ